MRRPWPTGGLFAPQNVMCLITLCDTNLSLPSAGSILQSNDKRVVRVQGNHSFQTRRLTVVAKPMLEHELAVVNMSLCNYVTFIATTWYVVQGRLFARPGLLLRKQLTFRHCASYI